MRIAAIFALGLVLLVMGFEVARFVREGRQLNRDLSRAEEKLSEAKKESAVLKANLEYLARPENLEKEMRARFNYRGKDEKILILIPGASSSASSTQ